MVCNDTIIAASSRSGNGIWIVFSSGPVTVNFFPYDFEGGAAGESRDGITPSHPPLRPINYYFFQDQYSFAFFSDY